MDFVFKIENESVNYNIDNAWGYFRLQLLNNCYNTRANELPGIKLII